MSRADCPVCGVNLPLRAGALPLHSLAPDGSHCRGSIRLPVPTHAHFCPIPHCTGAAMTRRHGSIGSYTDMVKALVAHGFVGEFQGERAMEQYGRDYVRTVARSVSACQTQT